MNARGCRGAWLAPPAGEGVAVDADGNVYAAEGPNTRDAANGITKYVAAGN